MDNKTIYTSAVPYYGKLIVKNSGFERIFFVVQHTMPADKITLVGICVWEEKNNASFCEWLRSINVDFIICEEKPDKAIFQSMALQGIKIISSNSKSVKQVMRSLSM